MAEYQLTLARIVRVGQVTTHVTLDGWAQGQITVPVDTSSLMEISGLTQRQLSGARFDVTANTAAVVETDVNPHSWRL
ncbi:hypothetical protein ACIP98_39685 [Streptomyces sp. NPDC088354]|uniref:hypothetical protein n=1 Tax=Streptomyces sp. NPDC088354 TaxID=3365856 RepID=UPI003830A8BB